MGNLLVLHASGADNRIIYGVQYATIKNDGYDRISNQAGGRILNALSISDLINSSFIIN